MTDTPSPPPRRQLTDLADVAGRTVARAVRLAAVEAIGIVFTDGSFLYVNAYGDHTADGTFTCLDTDNEPSIKVLERLGLATPAEIAEDAERDLANERARSRACEAQDRREYERLRAKFEGGTTP